MFEKPIRQAAAGLQESPWPGHRYRRKNIGDALREIRVALLEADVNLNVVKELIEHIREKAVGQQVMTAPFTDRAGDQDRPRRIGGAAGQGIRPRFNFASPAADGHPDGRSTGLGQNHDFGEAGSMAEEGRP